MRIEVVSFMDVAERIRTQLGDPSITDADIEKAIAARNRRSWEVLNAMPFPYDTGPRRKLTKAEAKELAEAQKMLDLRRVPTRIIPHQHG